MNGKKNRWLMFLLTFFVLLFIYVPMFYLLLTSISPRVELLSVPIHWIPENPTLKNYLEILLPGETASEVARTFKITLRNSLFVASSVTLISLVVGSLAAYALSRIRVSYRSVVSYNHGHPNDPGSFSSHPSLYPGCEGRFIQQTPCLNHHLFKLPRFHSLSG